jgi:selenocysteine-specific elongation factor
MDIIVGTAGHIDHGKTALVKALTGIDADRLPEEKERGITIDIGFAELDLGDVRIGFVDVPGHEKFVKNMLAGASGIDVVLLVVAADEGVMPQTREHFEICRLLGIKSGVVALTKSDLVDDETLELARLDVSELVAGSFLENAELVSVSSRTGDGLEQLKHALTVAAKNIPERSEHFFSRLSIDRSFSVKGYGAVVTGTVSSGEFFIGDEIDILPLQMPLKVRGLQSHGRKVESVHAGQRAALNLAGIDSSNLVRGMVLSEKAGLRPTHMLDARVEVLATASRPLRTRQRVRLSIGTIEALARVQVLNYDGEIEPGKADFVQFSIETPVVTIPGDRFIIRSYSPQTTVAGGSVVDPFPDRHRRKDIPDARDFLTRLSAAADHAEQIRLFLADYSDMGADPRTLAARSGLRQAKLTEALSANIEKGSIVKVGDRYIGRTAFEDLKSRTLKALEDFHRREPLAKGMKRETLREQVFTQINHSVFRAVIESLEKQHAVVAESDTVRLATYDLSLSGGNAEIRQRLERIYDDAGFEVPKLDDALAMAAEGTRSTRENARKIFQLLINDGRLVKISDDFYFSRAAIEKLIASLKAFADTTPDRLVDVPKFKEIAGISRKYAIPLLEFFDREKLTRRAGDKRLIL